MRFRELSAELKDISRKVLIMWVKEHMDEILLDRTIAISKSTKNAGAR